MRRAPCQPPEPPLGLLRRLFQCRRQKRALTWRSEPSCGLRQAFSRALPFGETGASAGSIVPVSRGGAHWQRPCITGRSRPTPSGKAPRSAVRDRALRGALPLGAAHLHVMPQAADMKLAFDRPCSVQTPQTPQGSCAALGCRPCACLASRTAAGFAAPSVPALPPASRLQTSLRKAATLRTRVWQGHSREAVRPGPLSCARGSGLLCQCVSLPSSRSLASPAHNWSFDADAQRRAFASLRSSPPVAGQLQR
jgi:hypothetical protein